MSRPNLIAPMGTITRDEYIARAIVMDLRILVGDDIAKAGTDWRDVAGTLAANLRAFATRLDRSREGGSFGGEGFATAAALSDMIEQADGHLLDTKAVLNKVLAKDYDEDGFHYSVVAEKTVENIERELEAAQ